MDLILCMWMDWIACLAFYWGITCLYECRWCLWWFCCNI